MPCPYIDVLFEEGCDRGCKLMCDTFICEVDDYQKCPIYQLKAELESAKKRLLEFERIARSLVNCDDGGDIKYIINDAEHLLGINKEEDT
jgi:hypothetical protein